MASLDDRFSTLESMVASQRAALEQQQTEIAMLKNRLEPTVDSVTTGEVQKLASPETDDSTRTSRRKLLLGGAIAAGAAVAGATVAPRSAAATDGSPLVVGADNVSAGGNTRLNGTGTGQYANQNILTVSDQNATSQYPSAIGAYGEGDRVRNGIYAYTGARDNSDASTGHAVVAVSSGGRSNLLLVPASGNPNSDSYAHRRGEMRCDGNGDLWFCTNSGTPGVFRKLAGPQSSGAVHAVDPARVYDSRFTDGPLASGFNREVSVANAIDATTGAISQFDLVPSGATAVFFNVTVTETVGAGFVLVAPGSATVVTGSTINWSSGGQTAANGSLTTIDASRNTKVFVGGAGSTHFIIDITGYTA